MPFLEKAELIKKNIYNEYHLHPLASLIDYFKYFAQSAFGPGHIISDYQSTYDYLAQEIENSIYFDKIFVQSCNYYHPFYRVNLKLVKDKLITIDELLSALIESASCTESIPFFDFKREWEYISNVIRLEHIVPQDFEKDQIEIDKLLSHDKFLFHHSEIFKKKYNPHYRLIHEDFLPNKIKDLYINYII